MSDDTNWGSAYASDSPTPDEQIPVDKRVKQSKDIRKWFFGISIALMLISIVGTLSAPSNSSSALDDILSSNQLDSNDTSSWDSSWVPDGFSAWSSDSNIAWKWSAKNNCDQYGCISADFISRDGCPNGLYAALNWLDANDAVVSYDNATLPSLLPMQTAKLRFDDIQELGKSGQMAEINCR